MVINLSFLEGIEISGEKILLEQVIKETSINLGMAEQMDGVYYYMNGSVSVHVDQKNKIEYIEISTDEEYDVYNESQNLKNMSRENLLKYLKEKNQNEMSEEENKHSFIFSNISVGLYYEITEEDVEEMIYESKADGVYDDMKDEIEADAQRAKRPSTIGIGKRDYYKI